MRVYRKTRGLHILVAGVAVAILAGAGAAAAQGPGPRGGQGGPGFGPRAQCENPEPGAWMAQRLGLDEKQQEAVAKIREEGRARDLVLRKEIMRLRNELHGEMLKDSPAEGTVLALSNKMGDVQKQLHGNRLQDRLDIRKLLTPEQRDRMLMMDGPGGRQGRGGRHGHGGPNGPDGPDGPDGPGGPGGGGFGCGERGPGNRGLCDRGPCDRGPWGQLGDGDVNDRNSDEDQPEPDQE